MFCKYCGESVRARYNALFQNYIHSNGFFFCCEGRGSQIAEYSGALKVEPVKTTSHVETTPYVVIDQKLIDLGKEMAARIIDSLKKKIEEKVKERIKEL